MSVTTEEIVPLPQSGSTNFDQTEAITQLQRIVESLRAEVLELRSIIDSL